MVAEDDILNEICDGSETRKLVVAFMQRAKDLQKAAVKEKNHSFVEVEVRFGKMAAGRFLPGVCPARFRFLCEWLEQSIPSPKNGKWRESVVHMHDNDVRVEASGGTKTVYSKTPVESIVLTCVHRFDGARRDAGVAFRLATSIETPCDEAAVAALGASSKVRVRHRRAMIVDSCGYENAFSVDFTLAWQASGERSARELQRKNVQSRREIEVEIKSTAYVLDRSSAYLAASLLGKVVSIFRLEAPAGLLLRAQAA